MAKLYTLSRRVSRDFYRTTGICLADAQFAQDRRQRNSNFLYEKRLIHFHFRVWPAEKEIEKNLRSSSALFRRFLRCISS